MGVMGLEVGHFHEEDKFRKCGHLGKTRHFLEGSDTEELVLLVS